LIISPGAHIAPHMMQSRITRPPARHQETNTMQHILDLAIILLALSALGAGVITALLAGAYFILEAIEQARQ